MAVSKQDRDDCERGRSDRDLSVFDQAITTFSCSIPTTPLTTKDATAINSTRTRKKSSLPKFCSSIGCCFNIAGCIAGIALSDASFEGLRDAQVCVSVRQPRSTGSGRS